MTDHKGVRNDVLARGFNSNFTNGRGNAGALGIEVVSKFPNSQVNTLKGPLWSRLLQIIEQDAMLHLLLETSLFIPLGDPVRQNYFQLSGTSAGHSGPSEHPEVWDSDKLQALQSRIRPTT